MTLKKLPPNYHIDPIPTCETCAAYWSDLIEGISGAPAGLAETCTIRNIDIVRARPGCMLHSDFVDFLGLDDPINPVGRMPNDYDIHNAIQYNVGGPIQEVVSAYAMEGGKGLTKDAGLTGIIDVVTQIVEVITAKVIQEEIIPSIQSYCKRLGEHTNVYVERAIASLREELTKDVQDNGEE